LAVILKHTQEMFETVCDINGINILNPLFYSESYLQNEYVKANNLAKHIHLFNHQISHIEYILFNDLKGIISKITETVKEKIYDVAIRSEPLQIHTKKYYFNNNFELYKVIKNENGYQEDISFFDSLKMPKKLQIIKSFDNNKSSQIDITYSEFLEFDQIDEKTFYDNKTKNWTRANKRNTKYRIEENGEIYKIHIRNNKDEQSKTTIIYNNFFQVLESKTYNQKDKSELLYEAKFSHNNNVLKSIKYIRHKTSKTSLGNWTRELTFEYNEKGMLENFNDGFTTKNWTYDKNDNPISVTEFDNNGICHNEKKYNYKYDRKNNWTFKDEKTYVNNILKNEIQISREIEYYE
jgi:hypothetical protein